MLKATLTAGFITLAAASGAQAQIAFGLDGETGRYQMQPVEGGIVRLDTVTGAVDLCRVEGSAIQCEEGTVQTAETDARIEALIERVDGLERRIDRLEAGRPNDPREPDFEDAMREMRRFFESFRSDIERGFEDEPETPPAEDGASPGRTAL